MIGLQPPPPTTINNTFVLDTSTLQNTQGKTYPFVNDQTVPGVWSDEPQYTSSDGSLNPGGKYSLLSLLSTHSRHFSNFLLCIQACIRLDPPEVPQGAWARYAPTPNTPSSLVSPSHSTPSSPVSISPSTSSSTGIPLSLSFPTFLSLTFFHVGTQDSMIQEC